MGRRRMVTAAAGIAVVGIGMAIAGAWPVLVPAETPQVQQVPTSTPAPEATASVPPAVTVPPDGPATSSPAPAEVVPSPIRAVPRAPMTHLEIEGEDLLIDAPVGRMDAEVAVVDGAEVSVIDPPTTEDAYAWNARATEVGVAWADGAPAPTVLLDSDRAPEIFGHAGLGRGVFGDLTRLAVGDRITVTTTAGELVYEVTGIHETPKGAAGTRDEANPLLEGTGRSDTLLVASCVPDGPGGTSTTAAVYTAVLVESRPQD